jgi:hypothetical protein
MHEVNDKLFKMGCDGFGDIPVLIRRRERGGVELVRSNFYADAVPVRAFALIWAYARVSAMPGGVLVLYSLPDTALVNEIVRGCLTVGRFKILATDNCTV